MSPGQLNRRMFIRDFGRGVLGISIGGVLWTACSNGETVPSTQQGGTTAGTANAQVPASTASLTTDSTAATGSSAPTEAPATTAEAPGGVSLVVERVNLGFVSAYLMVRGTEAAIVDTGVGGSASEIGQALSEVGLGWVDVGTVILTHRHPDHVGSLDAVLAEAAQAVVGAGAADLDAISAGRDLVAFEDGQEVFGSTIIATPGHTEGHISVWDPTTRVLIAGDALNGGGSGVQDVEGVGGPNSQFTPDMASAIESARALATLKPETIFFGHGNPKEGGAASALNNLVAGL